MLCQLIFNSLERSMSEKKPDIAWWILLAGVAWMAWNGYSKVTPPGPQPDPVPVVSIEKDTKQILATIRSANARIFLEAADGIEKGTLKTDKELFDFVRPATEKARKEANKPFDVSLDLSLPRNSDGTFAGKEVEAAALLRKISRAW
jgi:hypothetical protein